MRNRGPEESFQSAVIDLAHLYGWIVAHFRRARTKHGWTTAVAADGKGFPDLLLCHAERSVFLIRELKVPPNHLTPEQAEWIRVLCAVGINAKVWVPDDWPEIEQTLKGEA